MEEAQLNGAGAMGLYLANLQTVRIEMQPLVLHVRPFDD